MNKIKVLFLMMVSMLSLVFLASCSSGAGITGEMEIKAARQSITVDVEFSGETENFKNNLAKPYVRLLQDGTEKKLENISFSGNLYHSATVTFRSLTADTEYTVELCITYEAKEYLLKREECKTTSTGSEDGEAVKITSTDDFLELIKDDNESKFELAADLDFTDINAQLFTDSSKQFKGTFDGAGHVIKNLNLSNKSYTGLFGNVNKATFKNIVLENVTCKLTTTQSTSYIGALCGSATDTTFENITINGLKLEDISTYSSTKGYIGGLVGLATNCQIENCTVNGNIKFIKSRLNLSIGLLVGRTDGINATKEIKNNKVVGEIVLTNTLHSSNGNLNVGGLIGHSTTAGTISGNVADTSITSWREAGSSNVNFMLRMGGLIGYSDSAINGKVEKNLIISDIKAYACANLEKVVEYDSTIVKVEKPADLAEGATDEEKTEHAALVETWNKFDTYSKFWGDKNEAKVALNVRIGGICGLAGTQTAVFDGNVYLKKADGIAVYGGNIFLGEDDKKTVFIGVLFGDDKTTDVNVNNACVAGKHSITHGAALSYEVSEVSALAEGYSSVVVEAFSALNQ